MFKIGIMLDVTRGWRHTFQASGSASKAIPGDGHLRRKLFTAPATPVNPGQDTQCRGVPSEASCSGGGKFFGAHRRKADGEITMKGKGHS